ncbi:PQQ-binding-like beta-propeller repeat protein [Candidatus Poribacteria bacterium]|nr:PQQ-binding-like beta-propeller repeat protein [Candidatus Poribacteria bacterium]MYK96618.1 PQQ-binding-like beta-propeller repeat protein [Candidatus Poribacteria bacterium]
MKTSFFLIFTAIIVSVSVCSFPSTAQDNPQIGLPEDAIARIGRGALGEVRFSPDGSQLAISTSIGIWFHDPQTGKALELLQRPNIGYPFPFAFSPDGNRIGIGVRAKKENASGSSRYSVEVWDATTGEAKEMRLGHLDRVKSITFSPDGSHIASASFDGFNNAARLWNVQTGKRIPLKNTHPKGVNLVVFSLDGPIFATVGRDDNTTYLWDGKTGNQKITLTGHTKQVSCIAYSPDNKIIATGSYDGTIRLWDATTGTHQTTLASAVGGVRSLAYSPDGNTIVCGGGNGSVQLWDTQTLKLKSTLTGHTERVKSVAYAPDRNMIATGSSDGTVRLWDAATGKPKATLTGYMRINAAAYSPDSQTIVTGNQNGKVHFWDASTGKLKNTFTGDKDDIIFNITYSPDGKTIAVVSSYNDRVLLRDAKTGKHKATLAHFGLIDTIFLLLQNREYDIGPIAYSPDGNTIVTGGDYYTVEKGTIYLWDARTGIRKRVIFKGPGAVRTVVFSKDGKKIIATGDWKNEIRVWDARTGKELTPTLADIPRSGSKRLLHSPDGTTTAQVSQDGTVLIRERKTTLQKDR